MPARSFVNALADSPAGPLLARVAQLRRIAQALSEALARLAPDFDARDPRACELKEDVLLLNARSAAQASKLRQGVPRLLLLLHQQGALHTEIRVRVQPARSSYPEQANDPAQVSASGEIADSQPGAPPARPTPAPAVAGVRILAETLARDLPDSPLKEAAARLQASLTRGPGSRDPGTTQAEGGPRPAARSGGPQETAGRRPPRA